MYADRVGRGRVRGVVAAAVYAKLKCGPKARGPVRQPVPETLLRRQAHNEELHLLNAFERLVFPTA